MDALRRLCDVPELDVVVVARGGGSFEDLLPFSDERLVRAIATSPVPIVSAVGHEQDTPLCDLAADVRASTPTAAARLVVPDLGELHERLERARQRSRPRRPAFARAEGQRASAKRTSGCARAPALLVERRRAALEQTGRAPAGALAEGDAEPRLRDRARQGGDRPRPPAAAKTGERIDVEVSDGRFGARVE